MELRCACRLCCYILTLLHYCVLLRKNIDAAVRILVLFGLEMPLLQPCVLWSSGCLGSGDGMRCAVMIT